MKFSNMLSSMIFLLGMAVSPVSAGVIFSDDFAGGIGNWTTSVTGDADVIPDAGRMRLRIFQCANAEAYRDLGNAPGNITIDFDWQTSFDSGFSEKFRWGLELVSDGSPVWVGGFGDVIASGHISKTVYAAGNLRLRYWIEPYVEWCFFGDHGNSYFWIDNVVVTPTISGNAYADEGTTIWSKCDGATANISLVINGNVAGASTTSCDAATGAYSFTTSAVSANNPVSVFFNTTGGNTDKGVAVTVAADATSNIVLNPRKNIVWVKTEGAVANITNANLDHIDSTIAVNIPYNVSGGDLTVSGGTELHIESGKTFTPGGTVTTTAASVPGNRDGDIHINGTFSVGTNAVSVGGDWNQLGTFTKSAGQTTTFTALATGFTITPGIGNFYNVVFDGAGGGWSSSAALNIDGNLTMTNGTLSGTQNLTVAGGSIVCGASCGDINLTGGTATLTGTGDFAGDALSRTWTFNNLTFGSGGFGTTTARSLGPLSGGSITASNTLTIFANHTLNAGKMTWILNGNGTPFVINGTFTSALSRIEYMPADTTGVTVTSTTYYSVSFNKAGNTFFLTTGGITTMEYLGACPGGCPVRQLSILAGTLDTVNYPIMVGEKWINTGTFSAGTGTVTFYGTNQSISGNNTFYNFTKSTAADTLTFAAGSTQTFNGTVTLGGASGQLLSLRSSTPGTRWNFNASATATKSISYVDVQDSDASGSDVTQKPIYPANSADSMNNVGWFTYQIVKQVYDANGNCLAGSPPDVACNNSATTITVPVGPQLKFLLFVRNTAAVAMNDVRFQDLLDDGPTGFTYMANTIKYDVSQSDVATIANIYSAVNSGTIQTDALGAPDDYVSILDTNAGNGLDKLTVGAVAGQANVQVDIPAHKTFAVLFQATKK